MKYLLITYVQRPDGSIDEQVAVAKKARTSDIQTCNVIMNFKDKKVEKCVIDGNRVDTDWEKLTGYYREVYPELIEQLEKEAPLDNLPVNKV